MKAYGLLLLAIGLEGIIFTQLPLFIVPALTALVLIWVSIDLRFYQLIVAAIASGLILDSLRASTYAPWWTLTMLLIGVFVAFWRGFMSDRISSRRYLLRMYIPVAVFSSLAVTIVPYSDIILVLDKRRVLIELIIHSISLAIGLMLIRSFSKIYG